MEGKVESQRYVLTVEEAGRRLGLSRPLAYQAVNSGQIPSIRIGRRRILVPVAALEKMLESAGSKS